MTRVIETVTVSLGVSQDGGPTPATIFDRHQRRIRFQYLSPDQLSEMSGDDTARWLAEYVPGWDGVPARWELRQRTSWK